MSDANFVKDELLNWSEDYTLIEPFLKEASFEESYGDSVVVGAIPNIEHIEPICIKSLDLAPISSSLLPITPSLCIHFKSPKVTLDCIMPPWTLIVLT